MIYTLSGKNSYSKSTRLNQLVESAQKNDADVERIDAAESSYNYILNSVQSLSLLSEKKLVVVSGIQNNKELLEKIEDLISRVHEETDVVMIGDLDKRSKPYKVLKSQTQLEELANLDVGNIIGWAMDIAKDMKLDISRTDISYLLERCGSDQNNLQNELNKLSLSTDQKVTREQIDLITNKTTQSNIFELLEATFSGNKNRAIDLYREQRSQKLDPHYLTSMITWQLHALALAVYSDGTESSLVSAGQSPYTARKSLKLARSVNREDVDRMVSELGKIDMKMKSTSDADAAIEYYLLRV